MIQLKLISFLSLILILFSGCSSGSIIGGGSSTPVGVDEGEDIGDGVEMKISSISSSSILATGNILFSIELINRNSQPIELNRGNLNIEVIPGGVELFNTDSVEELYNSVFRGDTIFLSDIISINQDVSLELDDSSELFQSYIGQQITVLFLLDYEENFEQVTNLNLNFEDSKVSRNSIIKKTGPLEASGFKLYNSRDGKILEFFVDSKMNTQSSADISGIDVSLGNSNLNCRFSFPDEALLDQNSITMNDVNSKLNSFCDIPSSFYDSYIGNTDLQFEITFDYSYEETQSKKFTIPQNYQIR